MVMAKYYTGVGSRNTPVDILSLMSAISKRLAGLGWTLRSGGAAGADTAFEGGTSRADIFYEEYANMAAMEIASKFHPAWNRCNEYVRKLHARNAFQVLGFDLDTPSKFLVCWTPDGCISHATRSIQTGGTGTAISIADHYGVKVFNLARPEHLKRLECF